MSGRKTSDWLPLACKIMTKSDTDPKTLLYQEIQSSFVIKTRNKSLYLKNDVTQVRHTFLGWHKIYLWKVSISLAHIWITSFRRSHGVFYSDAHCRYIRNKKSNDENLLKTHANTRSLLPSGNKQYVMSFSFLDLWTLINTHQFDVIWHV